MIALPLQGDSLKDNNSGFVDPETLEVFSDQWNFIKNIKTITPDSLDKLYIELVENQADTSKISNNQKVTKGTLNITTQNQIYLNKSQLTPAY